MTQAIQKNLTTNVFQDLAEFLGGFTHDPLGFVLACFPWSQKGTSLENFSGPDYWQEEQLKSLGDKLKANAGNENQVIKEACVAATGVGKSAFIAWIVLWGLSTCKGTRGFVLANNFEQLKNRTFAEIGKWHGLFVGAPLFTKTATSIYSSDPEWSDKWRIDALSWTLERPEGVSGWHNAGSRLLILYDEASGVPDIIWEYTERTLGDSFSEILWCVYGNANRPEGRFFDCFHKQKDRWTTWHVDSRDSKFSNKQEIENWKTDWGEDSDFFRIAVKAEFPRSSVDKFISPEVVSQAVQRGIRMSKREYAYQQPIIGVDPARFGGDRSVIVVRQGDYIHKPYTYSQLDTMELSAKVLDIFREYGNVGVICVDGIGIGAGVVDYLRHKGMPVIEVQSSAKAIDGKTYANKRAELYGRLKDWLTRGGAIAEDRDLEEQLTCFSYGFNNKLQVQIESKDMIRKSLKKSPDVADAAVYTMAAEEHKMISFQTQVRPVKKVTWL